MPAPSSNLSSTQTLLLKNMGSRLRAARLRRGLPVTVVAERSGMSRPTLNKVEAGDGAVTLSTYLQVLSTLGLEQDLEYVGAADPTGRALQDLSLSSRRRAPKRPTALPHNAASANG